MSKLIVGMDAVLNTAPAQAKLDAFRDDAKRNPIDERVKLNTADTTAQLKAWKTQVDKTIGTLKTTVTLDGKKALADATKMRVQLDRELGKVGVEVDLKTDRADAQMAAWDARVSALSEKAGNDSGDKFGKGFVDSLSKAQSAAPWWTGLAAGIPVVSAIGGAALAAAAGLTGMAVAGGVAAGVFASVAIPVLSKAKTAAAAVATAQTAYNTAVANGTSPAAAYATEQKAISAAYAGMSPQQIALSKQLGDMSKGWTAVEKAESPVISGALQPWLASVTSLMKDVQPIIADTAPVVKDLGNSFNVMVSSSFFEKFAAWTGQVGSKALLASGNGLIGFVAGIVKLLPLFTPLITDAGNALSGWGTSFDKWAGSASARADVESFLNWFHQNGKLVGSLLVNVGGALKALAPGLGPAGSAELKIISDFFGFVAKLPPSIAKPLTEVALALLTLNKLGVISVGVKIIGAASGWIKSLVTGGTVDIGAAGMQRAGDTMVGAAAAMQKAADTMVGADAVAGEEIGGGALVALEAGAPALGTMIGLAVAAEIGTALIEKQFSNWFNTGVKGATGGNLAPNSSPDFNKNGQPITPAAKAQIAAANTAPPASTFAVSGKAAIIEMGNFNDTVKQQAAYLKTATADVNTYTAAINKYGITSPQADRAAAQLNRDQVSQGSSASQAAKNTSAYGDAVASLGTKTGDSQREVSNYTNALVAAKGKTTDLTLATADGLFNALLKSGDSSTQAKNQIAAMAVQEGFSKQQADLLASSLVTQSNKADNLTKSQQTLTSVLGQAESQGKLTTAQTDALSSAIVTNRGHVDDSKQSFDHFANSLGISTSKANALWGQLKSVAGNYKANVDVNVSGGGTVSATVKITGGAIAGAVTQAATVAQKVATAAESGKLPKAAGGAFINGNHSNTDSVHIMAKPGELIVPAEHAPNVAQHMAAGGYKVPGFASGGLITPSANFSQAASVGSSLSAVAEPGFATKIGDAVATQTAAALTSGLKSAQASAVAQANEAAFGGASGSSIANATAAMKYLAQNLFSGNLRAAAGAVASIFGESNWNPESVGTGGFGLIGWTGNTLGLPAGYHGPTGNASHDFDTQLAGIIGFVKASGDLGTIAAMEQAASSGASLSSLAEMWGKGVERYGIDDVHSYGVTAAQSILSSLQANKTPTTASVTAGSDAIAKATQTHTAGGTISEPVIGFGVNSGTPYSFAENGPEYVGPISGEGTGQGMPGATQTGQQQTNKLLGQLVTLLAQQPQAMARVQKNGLSSGMRRGQFQVGG